MDRITIGNLLYKRNEKTPLLTQSVTGDEKLIIHKNFESKRSLKKHDEPPLTIPKNWSSPEEANTLCLDGLERNSFISIGTKQYILKNIAPTNQMN